MTGRETVIKGLECCGAAHLCVGRKCPYYDRYDCIYELARDALALLKGQEPKVLTLEEACIESDVWYETITGVCRWGALCYDVHKDLALYVSNGIVGVNPSTYGKTWRCWDKRPTEEERKAVKWDE